MKKYIKPHAEVVYTGLRHDITIGLYNSKGDDYTGSKGTTGWQDEEEKDW